MNAITAPTIVRGVLVTRDLVSFGGRGGEASFLAPDPLKLLERLPLRDPGGLRDLYDLTFGDIADYLVELGTRLRLDRNPFLQEALEQSYAMSDQTPPLLRWQYSTLHQLFTRAAIYEAADVPIGIPFLEGWNKVTMSDGRVASIRAIGARAVHIIAGNSPLVAGVTIVRNAVTRSDAIVKAPSNDPLTALAIARTMVDMEPKHPITRHLTVAYWKGGTQEFEEQLYQPKFVEKLVAWGGFASVRHVTRYIQPGLELITLDPKRSATVIGREAFESDARLRDVALRAATDVGALNQLACVAARVIFVESGCSEAGIEQLTHLGKLIYEELLNLPTPVSTKAKRFDPELRAHIKALRTNDDFYRVIGGREDEGAIIVSCTSEPVEFYTALGGRVANLVPVDDSTQAVAWMNAYTQTIGVYPESLKVKLRDVLPLYGAQRMVTLGYANTGNPALPQDAIEPVRRMVRWIVDETCDTNSIAPLWKVRDDEGMGRQLA
jgi:hypothetical protein